MKEISELLKKNDIRALSYKRSGNVIIADTNIGKVVIKRNKNKDLWESFDKYYKKAQQNCKDISFEWVKGHSKEYSEFTKWNDLADHLAVDASYNLL